MKRTTLCLADAETFWPHFRWPAFADPAKNASMLAILPVVGMADHGLDTALDAEEQVALRILRATLQGPARDLPVRVLPPLRFACAGLAPAAFAVDLPTFLQTVRAWVRSVQASGFKRVVLFNASPWNEEAIDIAGRDLRAELGMQMFCVNLSGLGLDFHPQRRSDISTTRLQTLLEAWSLRRPVATPARNTSEPFPWRPFTGGATDRESTSTKTGSDDATAIVNDAATYLARLLQEIADHPPLAPHTPSTQ